MESPFRTRISKWVSLGHKCSLLICPFAKWWFLPAMKNFTYSKDAGLLAIRIGLGVMFILHGLPKLLDGPGGWEGLALYGLPFLQPGIIATILGFTAAIAEFGSGILLIIGLWNRVACIALIATMLVAFTTKLGSVTGWSDFGQKAGWPLELAIVFLGLLIAGPGRFVITKSKTKG